MKALAAAIVCFVLCQPAQAFERVVAGNGGFHHHEGGHGFGHRGSGLVLYGSGFAGPVAAPVEAAPPVAETPALAPIVIAAPAPLCPLPAGTAAETPKRTRGPHIIYIGHKPEIHGPKVVYGTE